MTRYCQNGYPVLNPGSRLLHTWTVPARNGHLRVTLRNGSTGFLLVHNMMRTSELIEDLTLAPVGRPHAAVVVDDWGHAVRPVRGQNTGYSNHAGGTATDDNATRHGLGRIHTYTPEEERQIRHDLRHVYAGTIRWGGDYHGRKDEMHREIIATLPHCEEQARALADSPRGKLILAANPGQRKVIFS